MFRKGGSTNEGVVSLAQPRRQYAYSNYEDLMKQFPESTSVIKSGAAREGLISAFAGPGMSKDERLANTLISGGMNLAYAKPEGNILGTIAKSFKEPVERGLKEKQTEDEFKRQIRLQAITGAISDEEKMKLAQLKSTGKDDRIIKLSNLKAEIERIPEKDRSLKQKYNLEAINKELYKSEFLKGESPASLAAKLQKEGGYNAVEATNLANFRSKLYNKEIDPKITNLLDSEMPEVSSKEVKVTPEGITFSETIPETKKNKFKPNKAYFNYTNGQLYLYKGNNKFQALQ
jgi:hypothetical protein